MNSIRNLGIIAVAFLTLGAFSGTSQAQRPPMRGHGRMGNRHLRMDIIHLLRTDSCRLDLESKMADSDARKLEADLGTIKNVLARVDTLHKQIRDAKAAGDSAQLRELWQEALRAAKASGETRLSIGALLMSYRDAVVSTLHDCSHRRTANGGGDPALLQLVVKPLYPNPVNLSSMRAGLLSSRLDYTISADADVVIDVSDEQGNRVAQLVNDHERAGDHSVTIQVTGWKSGAYFVRTQAGSQVDTERLLITN